MKELLDSLHSKILKSKFAEEVTEAEIEALVKAKELTNDDWIPCSERLPEERDWYLAVFQEPDTGFIGVPYIADYLLGAHTNYTTNEGWIIKDCTDHDGACEYYKDLLCVAWQPLPAPYQPKGEK